MHPRFAAENNQSSRWRQPPQGERFDQRCSVSPSSHFLNQSRQREGFGPRTFDSLNGGRQGGRFERRQSRSTETSPNRLGFQGYCWVYNQPGCHSRNHPEQHRTFPPRTIQNGAQQRNSDSESILSAEETQPKSRMNAAAAEFHPNRGYTQNDNQASENAHRSFSTGGRTPMAQRPRLNST